MGRFYREGRCRYGRNCFYKHEGGEEGNVKNTLVISEDKNKVNMVNILIEMSEERNTRKNMEQWERIFTDFSELNLTGKSEINAEELPTRERLAGWAQEIQSGDRRKKLQENVARTLKDMKEEKRTRRNIAHWERIFFIFLNK